LPVRFDFVFTDATKISPRPRSLRSAAARDFISRWFGQFPLGTSSWIHFPALKFSASDPPSGVVPRSPVFVTAAASDFLFPIRSLRQEAEHAALPFFFARMPEFVARPFCCRSSRLPSISLLPVRFYCCYFRLLVFCSTGARQRCQSAGLRGGLSDSTAAVQDSGSIYSNFLIV
jgi:hypothetical protein